MSLDRKHMGLDMNLPIPFESLPLNVPEGYLTSKSSFLSQNKGMES